MPAITLDKFIQENRNGLDPDGLPKVWAMSFK